MAANSPPDDPAAILGLTIRGSILQQQSESRAWYLFTEGNTGCFLLLEVPRGEASPLNREGSRAFHWDHCTLGCHCLLLLAGARLQPFPWGWQAVLRESEMCLTADFTAWGGFQPGSSSAPLSWWRAARALELGLFIAEGSWDATLPLIYTLREAAHFLGDSPWGWTADNALRATLLALAIKRTLQSLSKGNHNLLTEQSALLGGKNCSKRRTLW